MDIVQNIIFFVVYNLIYSRNYNSLQCLNILGGGGGSFAGKEYNETHEFWPSTNYNTTAAEFEEISVIPPPTAKFV